MITNLRMGLFQALVNSPVTGDNGGGCKDKIVSTSHGHQPPNVKRVTVQVGVVDYSRYRLEMVVTVLIGTTCQIEQITPLLIDGSL